MADFIPDLEGFRLVHEPARMQILWYLHSVEMADFTFLRRETGLTQGNLSSHLNKLEAAGYISMEKTFHNKRPQTRIRISPRGSAAFKGYVTGMHAFFEDLHRGIKR